MQYLKGRSSKKLEGEFLILKKKVCGQYIWAVEFFCRITDEIIKLYIEKQTDNKKEVLDMDFWILNNSCVFSAW